MVRKVGDPKACGLGLSLCDAETRSCSQMSYSLGTKPSFGSSHHCSLPAADGACLVVHLQALLWETPMLQSHSNLACVSVHPVCCIGQVKAASLPSLES